MLISTMEIIDGSRMSSPLDESLLDTVRFCCTEESCESYIFYILLRIAYCTCYHTSHTLPTTTYHVFCVPHTPHLTYPYCALYPLPLPACVDAFQTPLVANREQCVVKWTKRVNTYRILQNSPHRPVTNLLAIHLNLSQHGATHIPDAAH